MTRLVIVCQGGNHHQQIPPELSNTLSFPGFPQMFPIFPGFVNFFLSWAKCIAFCSFSEHEADTLSRPIYLADKK